MPRPTIWISALDVVETGSPPPVTDTANHPNWTYVGTTTTGGGFIDVSSSNAAGGNIHFTGPITNPLGGTVIGTSDGNLLADNPGAVIQTAAIDLEADQGTLGTPSQSLPVQLVFTPGITTAISRATGGGGVYLDVQPTSSNAGPFNLPVNNVSSANGSVTLKFEDGQAASAPTSDTITVQNVNSTQGNVTIVAGTSSTVPSDVVLTGQITSPLGTTTITTSAGNIIHGAADQLIRAHTVTLTANHGSVARRATFSSTWIPISSMPAPRATSR